jgi:hypothetical protein
MPSTASTCPKKPSQIIGKQPSNEVVCALGKPYYKLFKMKSATSISLQTIRTITTADQPESLSWSVSSSYLTEVVRKVSGFPTSPVKTISPSTGANPAYQSHTTFCSETWSCPIISRYSSGRRACMYRYPPDCFSFSGTSVAMTN